MQMWPNVPRGAKPPLLEKHCSRRSDPFPCVSLPTTPSGAAHLPELLVQLRPLPHSWTYLWSLKISPRLAGSASSSRSQQNLSSPKAAPLSGSRSQKEHQQPGSPLSSSPPTPCVQQVHVRTPTPPTHDSVLLVLTSLSGVLPVPPVSSAITPFQTTSISC